MSFVRSLFVVWSLAIGVTAWADEAAIRKNLGERLPNFPPIDEVSKTPIPGLYELRIGTEVLYTDEQGHYVIEGSLIDTKSRANLTEARIAKLTQIDFASLPLKDAILIKQGSGARKLVVFGDPNCGYCKKLERDLLALKDVRATFGARASLARSGAAGWSKATRRPSRSAPATARRSNATWRWATAAASPARQRWCSKTAADPPAPCRPTSWKAGWSPRPSGEGPTPVAA
jgi:hypothetical protein